MYVLLILCRVRLHLATAESPPKLFLGQVKHRLNGAAKVHQAKGHIVNVAEKHVRREVVLEREQGNRREVVKHNDGQDDEDRPKGFLLHRMHGVSARHGLSQGPEDGYVAEHHESKHCEDHHCEDLLEVEDVAHTFSRGVNQNEEPDQKCQDCSVFEVFKISESEGVDHSHVAVQADAR